MLDALKESIAFLDIESRQSELTRRRTEGSTELPGRGTETPENGTVAWSQLS
jgi:hypothetical protein